MRTKKLMLVAVGIKSLLLLFIVASIYLQSADPYWFNALLPAESVAQKLDVAKKSKNLPDLNARNADGRTGLMYAIDRDELALVKTLLAFGADPDIRDTGLYEGTTGNTALHRACYHGNSINTIPIVDELLKYGADPRITNDHGSTPLHVTGWITNTVEDVNNVSVFDNGRRMEVIRLLINAGADINARDKDGKTLLHLLVDKRDRNFMENLIKTFSSLINREIKNNKGQTPLMYARDIFAPDPQDLTKPLLMRVTIIGADGNTKAVDDQGRNGLMLAIMRNDKSFAQDQIKRGADLEQQSNDGDTALHYAVMSLDPITYVTMLLAADPRLPMLANKAGDTPLHRATYIRDAQVRLTVLDLLLKAGANLLAQNAQGQTLLHLADKRKQKELVDALTKQFGSVSDLIQNIKSRK